MSSAVAPQSPVIQHQQLLKDVFGYDSYRDGQQTVIEHTLAGNDSLVLMPTGGGKSLCYQIPALAMPGTCVVVSPLISLMKDQVDALQAAGVRAEYLTSAQSPEQTQQLFRALHDGHIKLLYVAPERLMQLAFIERLHHIPINLFAIDEAHCVSHWGHDFRQDYRLLGNLKRQFPGVPITALTATADLATRHDIIAQLGLDDPYVFKGSFDRPNIRYNVLQKYKPFEQLKGFVQQQEGSGIVYCNSRAKVDDVAAKLAAAGFNAAGYHAGLESEIRDVIQQGFLTDRYDIIVATVAFGMGINKSDVRYVVHYDLPRSVESYYQETGRAGRDGMPAEALLLFDEKDVSRIQQWIANGDNSDRQDVELQKFAAMEAFADAQTCRRQILLNYFSQFSANHCGNCDICLDPPKRFDGSVEAQKILSCVYRVGQQSTPQHVVDVLRGKQHKRIVEQGHQQLTTHGIGKDQSEGYWHNLIFQLIHQGLLRIDITQNGVLKLTEGARAVLKGEQPLTLAVPRLTLNRGKAAKATVKNYDRALFAKLKHLRKSLAEQEDIPPFVVFSDASLADMADKLPTSSAAFLDISGVGLTKLDRYGDAFLQVIRSHLDGH
ncbi:DNA helicase RecQ [Aestuariibacter halophilus]|uniref:DNA helicase RecQ n=1 Tax=Fluctibacter halophilus TaxID=226011 RepID=A0ABS8GBI0_9ALTE|nr:DNA helicase RecQ [Aestuariibacter halophilus]MCC2617576.1 DNA helicase RecQ [Aestuariibacter halophilus]